MENFETFRLDQTGQQTQEILDQVSTNTADIAQLRALYEALTQSEPVIIQPSDTWPVADPQENVIYRVIDRVNTPPQSYSDYMWNGTAMVLMATYNNSIDNEPTPGSNNLVKSGGVAASIVFDISAYHATGSTLATYSNLAAALGTDGANVPSAVRKGGMSVKFVQSSDNKYVQYRLMSDTFNTTVANWQGVDDVPTAWSDNLVKSGGVYEELTKGKRYLGILKNGDTINQLNDNLYYLATEGQYSYGIGSVTVFPDEIKGISTDSNGDLIEIFNIQLGNVYYKVPYSHLPIHFFHKVSIQNAVNGKVYWLQINYTSSVQQFTCFRTTIDNPTEYDVFVDLKDRTTVITSGIHNYTVTMSTGEIISVTIDWSQVTQGTYNYHPNNYIFKKSVFNGNINRLQLNTDIFDATLSKQGYAADAKATGDLVDSLLEFDFDWKYPNVLIWKETTSDHQGGAEAESLGYKSTDFYDISYIKKINICIQALASSTTAGIACYDENKQWISSLAQYDVYHPVTILSSSLPAGTKYIRLCTETNWAEQYVFAKGISKSMSINEVLDLILPQNYESLLPKDIYWAVCGDSVTNANHTSIYDIPNGDPYMPIDGYAELNTYKRKNYAYYFAKKQKIKWANYGYGGTTLTHTAPKAYENVGYFFPFCDERMTQLKAGIDWDYISIFFGINDAFFNPIYQRDLWLTEQYGVSLGYPNTQAQIGADGFANAEQKAACDAATGSVGGVYYDNANDYFFAKFIGEITDTTKNTWFGAWNNVLPYLMAKYKKSKIMIVATYEASCHLMRNATKQIAEKWGVTLFDFNDLSYWYSKENANNTPFVNPDNPNGWVAPNGTLCPNTIEGYEKSRLSYDLLHPSNLGYQILSEPFGTKMMNG